MAMDIKVLVWNRHKNVVGFNWSMGSQSLSLWYWDLQRKYRYKQTIKKPTQICFNSKRPHIILYHSFFFVFFVKKVVDEDRRWEHKVMTIAHVCLFDGVQRHFQQYFSYIAAVSFIGGGNRSTQRKPLTCGKSLTNFITLCRTSRPDRDSNSQHQRW